MIFTGLFSSPSVIRVVPSPLRVSPQGVVIGLGTLEGRAPNEKQERRSGPLGLLKSLFSCYRSP